MKGNSAGLAFDQILEKIDALDGALSKSTLSSYRRAVVSFDQLCFRNACEAFPATEHSLVQWIEMLSQTCCPRTIQGYLSSLHAVHRIMEWPWVGDTISIQHAIRKLYRVRGFAPRQAFGITHEMRDAMIAVADAETLEGAMHRALVRTGYETLFRGAELRALQVHDLSRRPQGGYDIHLGQSKTDQVWKGFWTVVSASCAELLDQWIDRAGIESGFIFRRCRVHQVSDKPLTPTRHRLIYRELAVRAGFPADTVARIGTHSMRVGCAQDMVRHGYSLAQIMRRGNWSNSEMVARYTEATALQPMF